MTFLSQLLIDREQKLLSVSKSLKSHFIGVDDVIDQFIQLVRPWYLTPEFLDRPLIINLWGMTGVGKTDLIRRFVKLIDFNDRFLEFNLTNNSTSAYFARDTSVAGILARNRMLDSKPSVLFFDEIQYFRSLDQEGKEITNRRFEDFWELLSDGYLSRNSIIEEYDEAVADIFYEKVRKQVEMTSDENSGGRELRDLQTPWMAIRIQRILGSQGIDLSIKEILTKSSDELLSMLESYLSSKQIFDQISISGALVIIGGNLDSLYSMSSLTSEAEVDADIFYDQTTKLSIVDVKNSLRQFFRPEQISRLGNSHIIYPSLRRQDFQNLIRRRLNQVEQSVKHESGLSIHFDHSITDLVYQNGVFPTQGVRPVFSAIFEIIVSRLGEWLLLATKGNHNSLKVAYDEISRQFMLEFLGDQTALLTQSFIASLDRVRSGKSIDEQTLVAVHEAGHAIVYALLFGLSPLQLKSRLASFDKEGFTFPHKIEFSRHNLEKQLQVLVAGYLAEELVFGQDHVSAGHQADIERATTLVSFAIRQLNYGEVMGKVVSPFSADASNYQTDIDNSNKEISRYLEKAVSQVTTLLSNNIDFLMSVANALVIEGFLTPEEFIQIAKQNSLDCQQQSESWVVMAGYHNILKTR